MAEELCEGGYIDSRGRRKACTRKATLRIAATCSGCHHEPDVGLMCDEHYASVITTTEGYTECADCGAVNAAVVSEPVRLHG